MRMPFQHLLVPQEKHDAVMADGLADHRIPPHAMQLRLMLRAEGGEGNGNPLDQKEVVR